MGECVLGAIDADKTLLDCIYAVANGQFSCRYNMRCEYYTNMRQRMYDLFGVACFEQLGCLRVIHSSHTVPHPDLLYTGDVSPAFYYWHPDCESPRY